MRMKSTSFLELNKADGIKTKISFERIKEEVTKRMLVNTELNDANLISAINAKVIPVTAYQINICKFNNGDLNQLDQVIKKKTACKEHAGETSKRRKTLISNKKKVEED